MIAVAAHNAAITEACASSPGRSDRARWGAVAEPVVIAPILPAVDACSVRARRAGSWTNMPQYVV
ncbi:hypothetical protein H7I76_34685 [Mycolicibacterium vaccae]|nr:hypothetical protein [Mycolicibacterium vaccae]